MRVVIVSKAFVRGAYQRKLEEIAKLTGVDLTLITPPSWIDSGNRVELDRQYTTGYEMKITPIRFEGRFHLYHFIGLDRILAELKPDIVHVDEEPYNVATLQAVRLAGRLGARSLFFTWQNLYRRLPLPFQLVERYVYQRSSYAIAGNTAAVDVLRRKGYAGPCAVIPQFGIDPELFSPSTVPPEPRPFTIGYIGRLVSSKGLLDLLAAAAAIRGDWRLELVGVGPLESSLRSSAEALGIHDRLRIRPEVPSTQVPEVLNGMDCLVLPSVTTPSWKEQFGRVLIEAMACSVPVIGSDSGEIPHVIGEAGLVFPEGDRTTLAEHLSKLATDTESRRRLGRMGRERALAKYTHASIASSTWEVYRGILANP